MPLANYTTQVPAINSVNEIQRMLVGQHAKSVMIDYDTTGEPVGVAFLIPTKASDVSFRLPANVDACKRVLERQAVRSHIDHARASRVAWHILRDWVRAQMAILETEMVTLEEVMLPYMRVDSSKTLYQVMQERQFLMITQGEQKQ